VVRVVDIAVRDRIGGGTPGSPRAREARHLGAMRVNCARLVVLRAG
jgi:hypothetical protein